MEEFNQLLTIIDRLMGPDGCPWDQKQTLISTQPSLLEEAYELMEAIDLDENDKVIEELGDLVFVICFCLRLGEKEKRFKASQVLQTIIDKLIYRHPHVFGEKEITTVHEVEKQWEELKKVEYTDRKSALDGIPKGLPALARAQKLIKKIEKTPYPTEKTHPIDKKTLGTQLLTLVRQAQASGLDAELALREESDLTERTFREWETNKPK